MTAGCSAPRHDATGYQRYGCRCEAGRLAQRRYFKARELAALAGIPARVPNVGTVRRVEALAWMGWSRRDVETAAGLGQTTLDLVKRRPSGLVYRGTAEAVAAVYDGLAARHGGNAQTARWARRNGWVPPLGWDDDTIDDPAAKPAHAASVGRLRDPYVDETAVDVWLHGDDTIPLTRVERLEVFRHLIATGVSKSAAAARLSVSWQDADRMLHQIRDQVAA